MQDVRTGHLAYCCSPFPSPECLSLMRRACQPQASVEPVHHAHGLELTIDVTQRGEGAHQQAPLAPRRAG